MNTSGRTDTVAPPPRHATARPGIAGTVTTSPPCPPHSVKELAMSPTAPTGPRVTHAAQILTDELGITPDDAKHCAEQLAHERLLVPEQMQLDYLGVGGRTMTGVARRHLGLSLADHDSLPAHGPRRAVWDTAFGIVNGFAPSAIAYYVLTRSLSPRLANRAIAWEATARLRRRTQARPQ